MDLEVAIQTITAEYVVPDGETTDPSEVAWEACAALTPEKLAAWEIAPYVIEAYRTVLVATEEEVTRALHDINIG